MFGISQLGVGAAAGSISPGGDAEWNAYFGALRSNVNARWQKAVDSYKTLKNVRETLGLPFMVNNGTGEGGPGATAGAWNAELEQQAVNIHAMAVLITGALDDVISGKRRVAPYENGDDWAIEKLPGDLLKIDVKAPGIPVLANAQTGQPENVQGTVGALWSSALAAVLVPGAGIYLTLRAIDSLQQNTQEKTAQTIALRNGDLIKSGKATPEQAAALTKAEAEAAAGLVNARANEKNAGGVDPEKWSPLVKTVVWGGVAIMGLWIAAKLIPSRSGGLATNPISSGARRKKKKVSCDPSVWIFFNGGDDIHALHRAIKSRAAKFGKVHVGGMGSGFGHDDINFCVQSESQAIKIARDMDGAVIHGVKLRAEVLHSERGKISHLESREMNPRTSNPTEYTVELLDRGQWIPVGFFGDRQEARNYRKRLASSSRGEGKRTRLRSVHVKKRGRVYNPLSLASVNLV